MTEEEIEEYINTTEPYDKAGGYAVQGIFSKYVKGIEGDFYNVMGLPIYEVNQVLKKYVNKWYDISKIDKNPLKKLKNSHRDFFYEKRRYFL